MDKAIHYVNNFLDWFNGIPGHQWYMVGFIVASLPITAGLVELYKRLHFKWNATELTNHAIDFVVAVTATLMTVCDFVVANGTNFSNFLPFLATVMPTITAFAPHVYDVSKAIHGWMVNNEAANQKERLQHVLEAADATIGQTIPQAPSGTSKSSSFGTEAASIDKNSLIQL